jgi:hypothetical protein
MRYVGPATVLCSGDVAFHDPNIGGSAFLKTDARAHRPDISPAR